MFGVLLIALKSRRLACGLAFALLGVVAPAGHAAEPLAASLREEVIFIGKPGPLGVQLETTLFRPPGDGPFPLVIINHGKAPGDAHFQQRQRYLLAAREFVSRGYAVATPMRQGFARSGGNFISGGCNIEGNGIAQADDVEAALAALARRPDIDASRTVVMGQSHGGLTTMALGARKLAQVVGLVNFAGGLRVESCLRWELDLAAAMGDYGAATRVPSLWFYGDNDEYFTVETWRRMFKAYTDAGGPARLVAYGNFRANSHAMFGSSAGIKIWLPEVRSFFQQLGLPFDIQHRIVLADHESPPPAPSGYAAIDDVARIPFINPKGRAAWSIYLDQPPPKAFAISPHGGWGWRGGDPAAMRRALERCNQAAGSENCVLYAVDDDVVWRDGASPAP
jgi:dienelactone hydrolase